MLFRSICTSLGMLVLIFLYVVATATASEKGTRRRPPRYVPYLPEDLTMFTWVFQGNTEEVSEAFVDSLDIDPNIQQGFIKLAGVKDKLEISLVQKPKGLRKGVRFCTEMLPAAVEAFYEYSGLDLEKLKIIEAVNVSNNRLRGCVCYVRVMVLMGFTRINRKNVQTDKIDQFCKDMAGGTLIEARRGHGDPELPPVSDEARYAINNLAFRDEVLWIAPKFE